ncbi:MAG: GNAT family N-acetyltransferase [Bergeyella sp.]
MKITEASIQNIPLIQEVAEKSWQSAYSDILSQEQIDYMLKMMYSAAEISSHLNNPDYHYFLIENEENCVGFIGFEHHYEPETTKLHRIYLLPEAKGKGFGKAGIDFLKEKTSQSGDRRIILNVNKNNNAKAVYEKQGFTVYGEGIFDIGNGYVMDDFLMEYCIK